VARKRKQLPAMIGQIQQAIRESGLSLSELGRVSGVSQGQLSRFIRSERILSLPAAARVCEALGIQLLMPAGTAGQACPKPEPAPATPEKPSAS
jgi:transcriptional regulator with XRE-family HTH domain